MARGKFGFDVFREEFVGEPAVEDNNEQYHGDNIDIEEPVHLRHALPQICSGGNPEFERVEEEEPG